MRRCRASWQNWTASSQPDLIMTLTVENESAATAKAVEVLMERLPTSKVARLLSS